MPEITESFVVSFPRDVVWRQLHDLEMVARSMPGVSLEGAPLDDHLRGNLALKLGPIATHFAGEADVSMDDSAYTGIVRGKALDRKNNSRARSEIRFSLTEESLATRLDIKIDFTLSGSLAQFSRGSIVQEVAQRLTREFARNLEAAIAVRLAPAPALGAAVPKIEATGAASEQRPGSTSAPVGLLGLFWSAFVAWLGRRFGRRAGGKDLHV